MIENDIKDIREDMKEHNLADDRRFDAVLVKLEMNHDVHIRQEELLKRIEKENQAQSEKLEKINQESIKALAKLAEATSHNSGQIIAVWKRIDDDKRAISFINDTLSFGVVVKWIFYLITGAASLFIAFKVLAGGLLVKLLNL